MTTINSRAMSAQPSMVMIWKSVKALPPSRSRQHVFVEHAARLALGDPEAARAWAMRGATAEERTRALTDAARALTDHDPDAAVALLQSLDGRPSAGDRTSVTTPAGEESAIYPSSESLSGVMTELAAHRPEAVVQASLRREETPERTRLQDTVFVTWAKNDATTVDQASGVAARWAREEPAAASDWSARLPAGRARTWALWNAPAEFHRLDPSGACAWAEALPDPALRTVATQAFAGQRPEP